jgi:hypothetical protein
MNVLSSNAAAQAGSSPGILPGGAYADEAWRFTPAQLSQLAELARLRAIGMENAEQIGRWMDGGMPLAAEALIAKGGIVQQFMRVSRAVRQIIILEREIAGLRKGPDRGAERAKREQVPATAAQGDGPQPLVWSERGDYDTRPLDQVVASVRKVLGADAPEDDPFAPPAPRKARDGVAAEAAEDEQLQDDAPDIDETVPALPENARVVTPAGGFVSGADAMGLGDLLVDEADDARSRGPPH